MLSCINKNSAEYQTLIERSGISDFILESICRDFLEKYDRLPYLDEIIGSNSEPYIRKSLQLDSYNSTNIDNILSITGASTIEQANISLNDQYRDVEVEIIPLNKDAIVETTKRPTEDNFDNWTEEDEILSKALRNSEGQLLAPNGKPSNLTERQYVQVRTKAFKKWFGDWENDPANASKVVDENGEPLVVYRGINDNNDSKLYAYFTNSKKEAEIYSRGLLTKGGQFFNNNKDIIFSIRNYIRNKYDIDQINEDALTDIIEDYENNGKEYEAPIYKEVEIDTPLGVPEIQYIQVGVEKKKYVSKYSKSDYNKAIDNYNKLKNATEELKELLDIIYLIENTTITNESQLTRQYDDIFYTKDKDKLDKLLDKYSDIINNNKTKFEPNIQEVFLNIKNPYTDEINSEDLLSNNKAYFYNHDGALLMQGNHFLVKNNTNQIKSATDNSGLFNRQNDPEPSGYLVFTNVLQKLARLYGIEFNEITNAELNSEEWKSIIPDVNSVNAFVYNGQIYINIDKANLDAPIHEMMHILVGSIRFQNPSLYTDLINLAEQFPNYHKLVQKFPGRTRNDINEEIFIEEVSKYLSGLPSNISSINSKLQYEISYNVKRLLDTVLMGEDSVKTLSNDRLFSLSLKELAQEVNSSIMKNNFHGTINVENSELHRKLNNIKSDLYNQGTLKEYCD